MPWTLAHPAAVLPLRGRLVPSALVAGAVAPDVWFHVPPAWLVWSPSSWWTHGPLGPVTVDLVVGLVLVGLWRAVVRVPVLSALPAPWSVVALEQSDVVAPRARGHAQRVLAVAVSVGVGAATHVVLDLFSHEPGGVTPDWSWLMDPVGPFRLYLVLQYLLSLVGLGVLAWWGWRWARSVADVRGARPTSAALVLVGAVVAGSAVGVLSRLGEEPLAGIEESVTAWLSNALIGGVTGAAVAVLIWSVSARLLHRPPRPVAVRPRTTDEMARRSST